MKTRTLRSTAQGRPPTRVRILRCLLLAALLLLLMMATGCDEIFADMLSGDGCGTHDVCSKKAAIAGGATGVTAVAAAAMQRREEEGNGSDTGGGNDDQGDSDSGFEVNWSLRQKPSDDHVWDAKENKWVLPTEEDKARAMRDKGYEFDEDYGDGGAWRKKLDNLEAVEIPKEKGDVTLPEYKSGLISPTAEARYDRLEARYDQLNEMERKALDEYKRTRNELREAQESGDGWLAGHIQKNLDTAKENVDRIQSEKTSLSARHEYHSDQQFQERYTEGWTVGEVASELFVDPFVHMIAPDMSDAVDVMANAIAARNQLQTQIDRQDSTLFGEHDRAMKELKDIISQRRDALEKGDTEAAARLKEKAEGVKDRLKDVAKRMQSIQDDNVDYQKKALKATLKTGTTAADRVVAGRGAYETTKYVAGKAGFQTEKPQIQAKKPSTEEITETAKGEAKQIKGAKEPAGGGKRGSGGGKPSEVKQVKGAKQSSGGGKGSGGGKPPEAKQAAGAKESGGGGKGGGGGKPPKKSLKQIVRENPNPAQKAANRAEAKAGWEQQYQAHAEKVYGKGNVPDIKGRTLPGTEKQWIARSKQLGLSSQASTRAWGEIAGINPSPQVQAMRDANPAFRDLDIKIRECWRQAGPGVGPGFKPDYYNRFVENMSKAGIQEPYFKQWMSAVKSGNYVAPDMRTIPPK